MNDITKPIVALCKQCNKKAEMQIVQKPVSFKPIGMYDNGGIPSVWDFDKRKKWEAQNVWQAISEYAIECSLCGHEEHSR